MSLGIIIIIIIIACFFLSLCFPRSVWLDQRVCLFCVFCVSCLRVLRFGSDQVTNVSRSARDGPASEPIAEHKMHPSQRGTNSFCVRLPSGHSSSHRLKLFILSFAFLFLFSGAGYSRPCPLSTTNIRTPKQIFRVDGISLNPLHLKEGDIYKPALFTCGTYLSLWLYFSLYRHR